MDDESAGSAGVVASAVRVSVMMTPMGMPPSRARPTTTVLAHPARVSMKEPLSKNPEIHVPSSSLTVPPTRCRGS